MAMTQYGISSPWDVSSITASNIGSAITSSDHAIQGKMLSVNLVISDWEMQNKPIGPHEIKYRLAQEMVNKMVEDNHMEFTKMLDPTTGEHKFHARIFVVPDTQVRILRVNKVATSNPW
jgi:hypothetical protein